MLKEDTVMLPTHLLAPMNKGAELLDQQFEKGWDAGVQCAFDIVQEVLGAGADLAAICARFMEELEMRGDE